MEKNKLYLVYIIGSLVFLTQPIWLSTNPPEQPLQLLARPTIRDFLANAMMLAFFFLNYYVLVQRLYFQNRKFLYFTLLLIAILAITILPSLLTGRNPFISQVPPPMPAGAAYPMPPPPAGSVFLDEIKHHFFLFLAVIFFTLMLRHRENWAKAELQKQQAKLDALKARINPHFLFNTLNSIYALALKKDDRTAQTIVDLAELMRYVITGTQEEKIALSKEIAYIKSYIELQKYRLGSTAGIDFELTENGKGDETIAPLILISFIENAFKHGVNPDEPSKVSVRLCIEEGRLEMEVYNTKAVFSAKTNSSGIGLSNAKERLEILYGDRHTLEARETSSDYTVTLKMSVL